MLSVHLYVPHPHLPALRRLSISLLGHLAAPAAGRLPCTREVDVTAWSRPSFTYKSLARGSSQSYTSRMSRWQDANTLTSFTNKTTPEQWFQRRLTDPITAPLQGSPTCTTVTFSPFFTETYFVSQSTTDPHSQRYPNTTPFQTPKCMVFARPRPMVPPCSPQRLQS